MCTACYVEAVEAATQDDENISDDEKDDDDDSDAEDDAEEDIAYSYINQIFHSLRLLDFD